MSLNVTVCPQCQKRLIAEEVKMHVCDADNNVIQEFADDYLIVERDNKNEGVQRWIIYHNIRTDKLVVVNILDK